MKELNILKSLLKRKKKVVEALVVIFMITGVAVAEGAPVANVKNSDYYTTDSGNDVQVTNKDMKMLLKNLKVDDSSNVVENLIDENVVGHFKGRDILEESDKSYGKTDITIDKSTVSGGIFGVDINNEPGGNLSFGDVNLTVKDTDVGAVYGIAMRRNMEDLEVGDINVTVDNTQVKGPVDALSIRQRRTLNGLSSIDEGSTINIHITNKSAVNGVKGIRVEGETEGINLKGSNILIDGGSGNTGDIMISSFDQRNFDYLKDVNLEKNTITIRDANGEDDNLTIKGYGVFGTSVFHGEDINVGDMDIAIDNTVIESSVTGHFRGHADMVPRYKYIDGTIGDTSIAITDSYVQSSVLGATVYETGEGSISAGKISILFEDSELGVNPSEELYDIDGIVGVTAINNKKNILKFSDINIDLLNSSVETKVLGNLIINTEDISTGKMSISINDSKVAQEVVGSYIIEEEKSEGIILDDIDITVKNSEVNDIIGVFTDREFKGDLGAVEITAKNSEILRNIEGSRADDVINLIGDTIVGGVVNGGKEGGVLVEGDKDTLNLSAYTTDFTTLNYEGIEEVNLKGNTAIDLGDGSYTSNESVTFNIERGSSIKADNGEYIMNTSLSNAGTIDLVGDSGRLLRDKLIINGDFTGDGGVLNLDMNAMDLTSDMIVVKGDFTGTQLIKPTMIDTETEFKKRRLDFMEVEGNNNGNIGFKSVTRDGMITKGRVTGSAFEWEIRDADMADGSDMWFITALQNDGGTDSGIGGNNGGETVVLPELPGYASLQNIGEDMIHSNVDSLYTRLGDIRRYKAENEGESLTKDKVIQDDDYMELSRDGVTVWTRATAEYFDYEANGDAYGYDGDVSGFDIGADYTFELSRDTAVVAGLLYGKRYGNFETSTSDEGKYVVAESADIDMDSWSLAAYGTFIFKDNTYLDLVAGYTDYESDIDAPGLNDSVDGDAIWGSAEVGHSFQVGDIWRVEPQVQLTYTEVDFDDTTNDIGTRVEYTSNNQLTGRIGTIVSAGIPINEVAQVRPWFGVSVLQEFMDPEDVTYGGTDFEGQDIDTYMEYKIGVQVDLNKALGMYVEGKYQTDYDDYDSYRGTLGVKYSF